MKKKQKIILFSVIGALVIAGVGTGIGIALNKSPSEVSMSATSRGITEGSGEYDWKKYDVKIGSKTTDKNKYYTHCDGDYISNIKYTGYYFSHEISYDTWFSIFDDFEAFFVIYRIETGQKLYTDVETTHSPVGGDSIAIADDYNYKYTSYICEVWIRTVD